MTGRTDLLRRAGRPAAVLVASTALLTLLAAGPAGADRTVSRAPARPNIVLITTDDQTLESLRVMTNVNRYLAAEGTSFANAVVSFPLCCPSRASWLTGQYSHNHGVVGNNLANGLARLDQSNTLAVWLQRRGYKTAFVGKYLNGYGARKYKGVPPGWNDWFAGMRLAYFNHTLNRNGKVVRYGNEAADYQSDVYTRTALAVLERRAKARQPFFLWLSYFAPHHGGPREATDVPGFPSPVPAPRHRGVFASEPLPVAPSFDEANVADKPVAIRAKGRLTPADVAAIRGVYRQRLESLLAVDEGVAAVVQALKARGLLKRTLIVFTSDNGFILGEHRVREGKILLYEPSVRVPLIFRGPGVPRGRRLEQPVANVDVAPTLVDAANARAGRRFDGRSLLPLFADPGLEWGRDLLLERGPGAGYLGPRLYTAIRTPRFVYAEHSTGERELYDLSRDPDQLTSLHDEPAFDEAEAELARRLAALRNCAGLACLARPELQFAAQTNGGGCTQRLSVTGVDARFVDYVDFVVDGRAIRRVEQEPYELALGPAPGATVQVRVRALAVLTDGRRLTLDRSVLPCR